jgi:hypothetical protein
MTPSIQSPTVSDTTMTVSDTMTMTVSDTVGVSDTVQVRAGHEVIS